MLEPSKVVFLDIEQKLTLIIIDELDFSGGTGSNVILEWKIPKNLPEPLLEGIMTSTMKQKGLSFYYSRKTTEIIGKS